MPERCSGTGFAPRSAPHGWLTRRTCRFGVGITWTTISNMPLAQIEAYKARMGWTLPFVSSHGTSFADDCGADSGFMLSVFLRDGDGGAAAGRASGNRRAGDGRSIARLRGWELRHRDRGVRHAPGARPVGDDPGGTEGLAIRWHVHVHRAGRVPDGFVFRDAATALFAEFAAHLPPDGGMGRPFAEIAFLRSAGFTDVRERSLTVEIPLADGETLWRWLQTHGTRKFLDDLSDEHRQELHRRLVADVDARATKALHRYAWLFTAYA